MSKGNLELAHDVIAAVEERDLDSLLELTDSEVEWYSAFAVSKGGEGVYRGHDGMRSYVADMNDAWEIVRLDVDHEMAAGGVVVFVGRIHYRGKESGIEGDSESGYVLRFSAGKLVLFRPFQDPEGALAALGVSD
jgi:ketosteroid isomerase-like protein